MTERSFILKDEMGLHARPAAMLMVRMLHVSSTVEIICGDRRADGKDVMSLTLQELLISTNSGASQKAESRELPVCTRQDSSR